MKDNHNGADSLICPLIGVTLCALSLSRVPRPLALLVAATLTAASLTACGGGDEEPKAPQADPSEPFTPAEEEEEVTPDTWPLTGLEVAEGESAALKHPILVTKIDNTSSGSPAGRAQPGRPGRRGAVEGGLTRLAVFFYSQVPENAGPVRSMRASDIGIVPAEHATVVTSGAAGVTIRRITDAGIPFIQEGGPGTYRDTSRPAPYNLMVHLDDTAKAAKQKAVRPADYLPWGDGSDLPAGKKATTFAAAFSGGHSTQWEFDGEHYVNTNSNAGADDQFPADTVLALQVEVGDAGYLDPAGNHVPETKFVGKGPAWLFHNGRVVRGDLAQGRADLDPEPGAQAARRSPSRPVIPGSSWSPQPHATSPGRSRRPPRACSGHTGPMGDLRPISGPGSCWWPRRCCSTRTSPRRSSCSSTPTTTAPWAWS